MVAGVGVVPAAAGKVFELGDAVGGVVSEHVPSVTPAPQIICASLLSGCRGNSVFLRYNTYSVSAYNKPNNLSIAQGVWVSAIVQTARVPFEAVIEFNDKVGPIHLPSRYSGEIVGRFNRFYF